MNDHKSCEESLDAARAEVELLRIGLEGAHDNADRMRKSLLAERDAIAEKIAAAIEASEIIGDNPAWRVVAEQLTGIHATIAREVGKA